LPFTLVTLALFALTSPCLGQEGPSARIQSYLVALAKAKTLNEIKPYFSAEFWAYTYAPLLDSTPAEQAELLAETAKSLQGFLVKGETITGTKATVSMADPKGEVSPLQMVKENGVWVMDLDSVPDDSTEDDG
jgi:hypothetical protein